MKIILSRLSVLSIVVVIILSACSQAESSTPEPGGPEDVYWEYWNACDAANDRVAESFLTSGAVRYGNVAGGPCSLTHDYLFKFGAAPEDEEKLSIVSAARPDVQENENSASLTWTLDEETVLPIIIMTRVDGDWKIDQIMLMK